MNADNGILWKVQQPRLSSAWSYEGLGLCPRCRANRWPLAWASWAEPKAGEPDNVKPALVIHLADGYEPRQVGPETAWVWREPDRLIVRGRQSKRMNKTMDKMGMRPQPGPFRPEPIFSVAVDTGALAICRNTNYRGQNCRCAVRVDIGPLPALIDKQRDTGQPL